MYTHKITQTYAHAFKDSNPQGLYTHAHTQAHTHTHTHTDTHTHTVTCTRVLYMS
jgi:hypothetical protein